VVQGNRENYDELVSHLNPKSKLNSHEAAQLMVGSFVEVCRKLKFDLILSSLRKIPYFINVNDMITDNFKSAFWSSVLHKP
jgi:hypothetical protein